ncbi:MAG: aminotransferase class V-fold PLP-dependent enzyme [bacterium]|nr:aminotransferase class V-fold PLP-dependent enzyme [bacterium]
MPKDLELDSTTRRQLTEAVLSYADDYVEDLPAAPASFPPIDPDLIKELAFPPPEHGADLPQLLDTLDRALDSGINTASGKFLSYIPSGGIHTAALGRLLGAVTNRYTGGLHGAPGLVAMEDGIVQWMCRLFDLPDTASGVLLSGGSTANLTATVAARSRLGHDFGGGVVYTSERAHHSVAKAATIAGIHPDRVRLVPADDQLRLSIDALRTSISQDVASGLSPMLIVASAGTTDTGTIDPLRQCAQVAAESGAWFHVDAAYGGFFTLTDRGRQRMTGIEEADSITLDAHKSLFLPFGVGGLLVRDRNELIHSLEGRGAYMQDVPAHDTLPNYFAMSPELTRPSRGLEVWLSLHLHGVEPFRSALDQMLDLAQWTADELRALAGIEVMADPELSIVAFRATAGDSATKHIAQHVNDSRDIHVSSTTVDGRFLVRLAYLSQRTDTTVAQRAVQLIKEALVAHDPD